MAQHMLEDASVNVFLGWKQLGGLSNALDTTIQSVLTGYHLAGICKTLCEDVWGRLVGIISFERWQ